MALSATSQLSHPGPGTWLSMLATTTVTREHLPFLRCGVGAYVHMAHVHGGMARICVLRVLVKVFLKFVHLTLCSHGFGFQKRYKAPPSASEYRFYSQRSSDLAAQ